MNILIVGGNRSIQGGVEQFCTRARAALTSLGGHQVEHVFTNAAYLRPRSLPAYLACPWALLRHRHRRWDCLWLQYVSFPDLLLIAVARLLRYRVLVTPHLGANWASQRNPALSLLGRRLLAMAHALALLSESQAEELTLPLSVPQLRILTFLPGAIAAAGLEATSASGKLRLVHAARLSHRKGSFLFIQTCARLKRAGRAVQGRLIGPCDETTRTALQSMILAEGLHGDVGLVGAMPEAELLAELRQADVLVHLSQVDSFPLIVLESIGCGVFPICWALPGARQITRSYCGALVQGDDPAQEACDFLLAEPVARLRQAADLAGRRLRADYDWRACVAACEQALRHAAGETARRMRGKVRRHRKRKLFT